MCPFVNASHPQCAAKLNLNQLARAFAHCAGAYTECPVYHRLLRAGSADPHDARHERRLAS
ncbi:MAG: hypothetical protein ACOC8F_08510 [Planctomycetota bacterium]